MYCATAFSQESETFTWSSSHCETCESSILFPTWYSDGTSLVTENMAGNHFALVSAVTLFDKDLVVFVGFGAMDGSTATFNPREAVTLESNSAPRMTLYALAKPNSKLQKGSPIAKKQFKDGEVNVNSSKTTQGCLFFPIDREASNLTVVVRIGGETFRFPFARDPEAHAKFTDPAKFQSSASTPSLTSEKRFDHRDDLSAHEELPSRPGQGSAVRNSSGVIAEQPSETETGRTSSNAAPTLSDAPGKTNIAEQAHTSCERNVAFAFAEDGQVISRVPQFTQKWLAKNAKKYPSLCFSQTPNPQSQNYVVVFSRNRSAFSGIYPTVRTNTSSNTTPVYGNGSVTDTYGGVWNYTYNGTATTTTTTTSQLNLPYSDTTTTLYAYSYDQSGQLVSRQSRSVTTREGGDGANTLGYNLGAVLSSIHIKERLLKSAVEDIAK